uniref:YgiT-type zinc finger domain-containing protein n=1 Tax=Candidatus Kentrum sp. LPFa TaxID=2126335 RepID=A0A450WV23_9GAMM|nr:MAG: YgiT-type zinc finger domain-containing protein [Candidatus Kentron sp. LPFa]VFK34564.1 MAG: YgiT-type zinc finger domain-containing protein [Candidatus Kentron sp. LPFa]
MKCAICRNGNTDDGFATVLLEREGTTLVYKHVPAKVCDNCGEETIYSLSRKILDKMIKKIRESKERGISSTFLVPDFPGWVSEK